jgi:hypothetical protein
VLSTLLDSETKALRETTDGISTLLNNETKALRETTDGLSTLLNNETKALRETTDVLNNETKAVRETTDVLNNETKALRETTDGLSTLLNNETKALRETTDVLDSETKALRETTEVLDSETKALRETTDVLNSETKALRETTDGISTLLNNETKALRETTDGISTLLNNETKALRETTDVISTLLDSETKALRETTDMISKQIPPNYFNHDGSVLTLNNNKLSIKNNELCVNDVNIYNQNIKFRTSMDINAGDLICMDLTENDRVVKGLGGKIEYTGIKNEKNINYSIVYDYDDSSFVLAYSILQDESIEINILLIDKYDYDIKNKYTNTFICSNNLLNYIIKTDKDNYTLFYCVEGSRKLKYVNIHDVFDTKVFIESTDEIELLSACDNMCIKYDSCYIIVYYNNTLQEFKSISLDNNFNINIAEQRLCNVYIQNTNTIQLLNIPGGTWIVSMGYVKFALLVSAGYMRCGDTIIDYNSIECIDMLYDQNNGIIMSMEKTISESFYIQAWDILGLNLQKLSNITFGNVNITPISINVNGGNYVALYHDDKKIFVHMFDFNGRVYNIGLRFACERSTKIGTKIDTKIDNNISQIYAINGTNKFIFYTNELISFITNYQGIPSGFIGVAVDSASENELCSVTIKGHIYYNKINMYDNWIGKKLYITETNKPYPYYMSISPVNGIFLGTCISRNRIILGL